MSGIYYIQKDDNANYYFAVKSADKFILPKKIYGNVERLAIRVWNTFAVTKKSTGIMLTGNKGSGKTILGEIISNLAIDRGLPVYMITEIDITLELVSYIRNLNHCVVFLDEFGKNVDSKTMDQMLTMFSDVNSSCKLFILTENSLDRISIFIKDRPGRIRYHLDFEKLGIDIYEDYLITNPVDPNFKKDLDNLYYKAKEFSFDILEAIVSEHIRFPNETLEDLLTVLNCKSLLKPKTLYLERVSFKQEEVPLENCSLKLREDLNWLKRWGNEKDILVTIQFPGEDDNEPKPLGSARELRYTSSDNNTRFSISWNELEMNSNGNYEYNKDDFNIELSLK